MSLELDSYAWMQSGDTSEDDALIAIQAAQAMANRMGRPFVIMFDLSVQESTEYTRERSVEIVHPNRSRYGR
jgi:hypothetical protein